MPKARKPKPPPESPRLPRAFDLADLVRPHETRTRPDGLYSWKRDAILAARDAQVRGKFERPVALRRSLLTERSIFVATINRLAPHRGLPCGITSPGKELTGTPLAVLTEAQSTFCGPSSVSLPLGVHANAFAGGAFHGVHVEQVHWEPRADGSRVDAFVSPFPLECVEWSELDKCLVATCVEGRFPVVHGDGRWIVTQQFEDRPWEYGAIVPFAALWGDVAFARRDRSQNAESHGEDKWIGRLPEGVPLDDPDAEAMLQDLIKLYNYRRAMLIPHGAEVTRNQSTSPAWQIFKEMISDDTSGAARIMLGSDGSVDLSSVYISKAALFGVRNDLVEGDLTSRGAAISTGLVRPWSLVNHNRWDRLAFGWAMPDPDEDARIEAIASRRTKMWDDMDRAKRAGCIVDQAYVNKLAATYKVDPPTLAASNASVPIEEGINTVPLQYPRQPLRAAT